MGPSNQVAGAVIALLAVAVGGVVGAFSANNGGTFWLAAGVSVAAVLAVFALTWLVIAGFDALSYRRGEK